MRSLLLLLIGLPVEGLSSTSLSPDQKDPKESHHLPFRIDVEVGINGIAVAAVSGLHQKTEVSPRAGGTSLARGEGDSGSRCAKAGGREVQGVLAVMVGEVRCPQVLVAIGSGGRPRSAIWECSADVLQGGAVG